MRADSPVRTPVLQRRGSPARHHWPGRVVAVTTHVLGHLRVERGLEHGLVNPVSSPPAKELHLIGADGFTSCWTSCYGSIRSGMASIGLVLAGPSPRAVPGPHGLAREGRGVDSDRGPTAAAMMARGRRPLARSVVLLEVLQLLHHYARFGS